MGNIATISTDVVNARDKFAFWRETTQELFGNLHSAVRHNMGFGGSLEYGNLGDLQLCRLKASSHSVERTPSHALRLERHYLKVVFQVKGCCHFEQHGRQLQLFPGQWSIYDMARSYRVFVPEEVEQLILLVPDQQLKGMPIHHELMVRSFASRSGLGRLMYELLNATLAELPRLAGQAESSAMATINQLLTYSILEFLRDDRSLPFGVALQARVHSHIMHNLRNPALNIAQIASALHCTKRYLHMVFADNENTIDELIWKLRLDGCRSDVENPTMIDRSLTDIAFSWGFNNYAHFSRRFRDEFGVSPRQVRAGLANQ